MKTAYQICCNISSQLPQVLPLETNKQKSELKTKKQDKGNNEEEKRTKRKTEK